MGFHFAPMELHFTTVRSNSGVGWNQLTAEGTSCEHLHFEESKELEKETVAVEEH